MESLLLYKIAYLATIIGSVSIFFFVIFKKEKKPFNTTYALMNLAVIIWAAGRYGMLVVGDPTIALLWARISFVGSILIYPFFLHAVLLFLGITKVGRGILIVFYTNSVLIFLINLSDILIGTNLFIVSVESKLFFQFYENPGIVYYFHLVQYLFIPQYALIKLTQHLFKEQDKKLKGQLRYLLFSSILGFFGGNSVVFLVLDIEIVPWAVVFVPFSFITMTYAIFRYGLMNFRIFATEIFAFLILILLLTQVVLSTTIIDTILKSIFFLAIVFFVYLIVRSVNKDVEIREKIEDIVKKLAIANDRLRRLEKQKTEFVSIASHQLRTPLTAIKGYASMTLEGSFGKLDDKKREPVEKIFSSSQKLVELVGDLLTMSRIEQGRIKYNMKPVDMKKLVTKVVKEKGKDAEDKKLNIFVDIEDKNTDHTAEVDEEHIGRVLANVIDNSIKYTDKGFIEVRLSVDRLLSKIRISISDTGIGMDEGKLDGMFGRFEKKTKEKEKSGVPVSRIGLYISQQILEAHNGKIWADSPGLGQGSTFLIEIPIKHK